MEPQYRAHHGDGVSIGAAGRQSNRVDYSRDLTAVRADEKSLLSAITGIAPERIAFLDQVHGDRILHLSTYGQCAGTTAGEADGMVTDLPGACLVVRTADCVPVFAYDPVRRALGAAHSGWRGARLKIAASLVGTMCELYGSDPGDMMAWILPSVGPESYVVGDEVASQFPRHTVRRGGSLYVDLWSSARDALVSAGVRPASIGVSGICTVAHNAEFFSYRRGDAGRNLNYGYIIPS